MSIFTYCILLSLFVLYLFQQTDLSITLLKSFDNFLLSFADKVTTRTYNVVSLILKIILLELASLLSEAAAVKTQYFLYLSFNSTLQLNNGISNNLQKLRIYFNDTAIVAFLRTPFSSSVQCFLILQSYIQKM